MGTAMIVGHPVFYLLWGILIPQPYENLALRLFDCALGFVLLTPAFLNSVSSKRTSLVFSVVLWLTIPFTFWWMYLLNGGNHVWLASMAAMMLIYYMITDWRLATMGLISAGLISVGLAHLIVPNFEGVPMELVGANAIVIGFCFFMGTILGVTTANHRREQLASTLATMGIMAHELRTPLATITLIADKLRLGTADLPVEDQRQVAQRLQTLVRGMNHHIDTQIANARLLRLPEVTDLVSAATVVRNRIRDYPFRSARERDCVSARLEHDFHFVGTEEMFGQAIDNLLKNALRSMAATGAALQRADIEVVVETVESRGRIVVRDRGVGIDKRHQAGLFEPFHSTNRQTGHGLGLAFCKRVVEASGGTITMCSSEGKGATVTIELPIAADPVPSGMGALNPASGPVPLSRP